MKLLKRTERQPDIAKLLKNYSDKLKLNVGCGTDYKPGWVNIDNNSDNNIQKLDLNWDLRNPLPFKDGTIDFIFNEHFMEHLTPDEGIKANKDFLRVLKTGGVLRIATPDLAEVVDEYLNLPLSKNPSIKRYNMEFIKTPAELLNMGFSWWGHKWLYDLEELERRLKEAGAKKMTRCQLKQSKHPELTSLETRDESKLIIEITK